MTWPTSPSSPPPGPTAASAAAGLRPAPRGRSIPTPTGADGSFGSGGLLAVPVGQFMTITSGTLQAGDKMVIAGGDIDGGLIARIDLSSGTLDTSFGPNNNGTVSSPVHASDFYNDI